MSQVITEGPMPHRRSVLPRLMASTDSRVIRTQDLSAFYSNPAKEAARLTRQGVLLRLATGYFVIVPEERRGGIWRPAIEDVALALGVADYGESRAALVGPSAARVLGALPRALSVGVLAVPVHRSPLTTTIGKVVFTFRNIERLDLQKLTTDLAAGYTATAEQTVLDLAARPTLGGISDELAAEARMALLPRCDLDLVTHLAHIQHRPTALSLLRIEAAGSD